MIAHAPAARCEAIRARVSEYLDGELDVDEHACVALHLERCPGCARVAFELAFVVSALRGLVRRRPRVWA